MFQCVNYHTEAQHDFIAIIILCLFGKLSFNFHYVTVVLQLYWTKHQHLELR